MLVPAPVSSALTGCCRLIERKPSENLTAGASWDRWFADHSLGIPPAPVQRRLIVGMPGIAGVLLLAGELAAVSERDGECRNRVGFVDDQGQPLVCDPIGLQGALGAREDRELASPIGIAIDMIFGITSRVRWRNAAGVAGLSSAGGERPAGARRAAVDELPSGGRRRRAARSRSKTRLARGGHA